jgi:hypothetical protein
MPGEIRAQMNRKTRVRCGLLKLTNVQGGPLREDHTKNELRGRALSWVMRRVTSLFWEESKGVDGAINGNEPREKGPVHGA